MVAGCDLVGWLRIVERSINSQPFGPTAPLILQAVGP